MRVWGALPTPKNPHVTVNLWSITVTFRVWIKHTHEGRVLVQREFSLTKILPYMEQLQGSMVNLVSVWLACLGGRSYCSEIMTVKLQRLAVGRGLSKLLCYSSQFCA